MDGLGAYLSFTFILAVTPGSTTAVVVRKTLAAGRAAGFAAAAGAALGNTPQATAAELVVRRLVRVGRRVSRDLRLSLLLGLLGTQLVGAIQLVLRAPDVVGELVEGVGRIVCHVGPRLVDPD